jgi:hypothetical protein
LVPWGWLTSELALFHVAVSLAVTLAFVALDQRVRACRGTPRLALVVVWWGLLLAQWRARPTPKILEDALQTGLRKELPRAHPGGAA